MSEWMVQSGEDYQRAADKWLMTRPVCAMCEEPIQEEFAFYFDGQWICEHCIEESRTFIGD